MGFVIVRGISLCTKARVGNHLARVQGRLGKTLGNLACRAILDTSQYPEFTRVQI